MLANCERLLEYHRSATTDQPQDSLFAALGGGHADDIQLSPAPAASQEDRLAWEKELLGLYVSGHPLDRVKDKLARRPMTISQMREKLQPGFTTVTGGIINDIRVILTKGGDQMAFLKLADMEGTIEAVIFPKLFAQHKELLKTDSCIALKGRLSNRNGELSLVAEAVKPL